MKSAMSHSFPVLVSFVAILFRSPLECRAEVKAWEETVTIPTYPWQEDVNPKFWALEGGPKLSTTVQGAIVYPYTMQDHLSRTKADRTYRALFLENEYLKVMCLPELGGRLHSVLDKTRRMKRGQAPDVLSGASPLAGASPLFEEMFHRNSVIKPGMIAMRGAWISGGVEWNTGPHGHTVGVLSPVDALTGRNSDGSAFIEISNIEKIFRTRWTVRVTLHPGKAYLDEQIRIENSTDGMHPYYFWNCTAFPNRPGTRFIYPMTLGTDHNGREFFTWPIHEGKDLSWLKNYETYQSIFSVECENDFFGAYDVDADRGIVQVADHRLLSGKKAWTWGNWDFGLMAQESLTDEDGPYIEVQSGPLPTQSDYGMLGPREQVAWQELWYPVHGLGDGFEYANRDVAVHTSRSEGKLQLRLLATAEFPQAVCTLSRDGRQLAEQRVNLSPFEPQTVTLQNAGTEPIGVTIAAKDGATLAAFTTPLPIRKVNPPDPAKFAEKPDDQLTAEETYLKGRKFDRDTNRKQARQYYELTLKKDSGHVAALRSLAVLDIEAGLYAQARARLQRALERDSDDGLSWYFLGVCWLHEGDVAQAIDCGYRAVRCFGTVSLGYDLAGRGHMRSREYAKAVDAFSLAAKTNSLDARARNHLALALYARGDVRAATDLATQRVAKDPTDLVPRALLSLKDQPAMERFVREARQFVGEDNFETFEASLVFADLGLLDEARRLVSAACVEAVAKSDQDPLPLYYVAYYSSLRKDEQAARSNLKRAAGITRDFVFASRPQELPVLEYAVQTNSTDANAQLHLGNLLAGLGRADEAVPHWEQAAKLNLSLSMAFRNLGLHQAAVKSDLSAAAELYRKAIKARPQDQTLHRDLAEILIADNKRPDAITVLETMPFEGMRRADILVMLAQAYCDEQRHDEAIKLLESTPYFVNWEGQDVTWRLFNKAHVARGKQRFDQKDVAGALADFEAARTYPKNLGVGRSNKPEEAEAQFWRGRTLQALGRADQAQAAWKAGAALPKASKEHNEYRQRCQDAIGAGRPSSE